MTPRLLGKVDLFIKESRNNLGVRFSQGGLKNKEKTKKYNEKGVHEEEEDQQVKKARKISLLMTKVRVSL